MEQYYKNSKVTSLNFSYDRNRNKLYNCTNGTSKMNVRNVVNVFLSYNWTIMLSLGSCLSEQWPCNKLNVVQQSQTDSVDVKFQDKHKISL